MAIIVQHLSTNNQYLLINADAAEGDTILANSPRLIRNLLPESEASGEGQVALCDGNGRLFWLPASEIKIILIDGKAPADILPETVTTFSETVPTQENTTDDLLEDDDEDWI